MAEIRDKLRDLSEFSRGLKQPMAEYYNLMTQESGSLFQGRCTITRPRGDAAMLATWAYVECNAFAAGIGDDPERGPFSSIEARTAEPAELAGVAEAAADVEGAAQKIAESVPNLRAEPDAEVPTQREPTPLGRRVRAGLRVLAPLPPNPVTLDLEACRDAEGAFVQPPLHERLPLEVLRKVVRALAAKLRAGKRVLTSSAEERYALALEAVRAVLGVSDPALAEPPGG